ncbi:MAG: QueT transporter family protein [Thermovenabulum sp.]|uniref:QueT transporter family protein n=1 Tax=Thermovenabulum sp. TaxID=3100335 RepID=UPI003C7E0ECC
MSKKIKDIAQISLVACLYAVLTLIFSSISYLPAQFRMGEIIKPISTFQKKFAISMMIGNFLSNLFSPFAGPMELIFMPLSNLIGCLLGYYIGKFFNRFLGSIFIAIWISASVALTLKVAANFPFIQTFTSVSIAETILMSAGYFILLLIFKKGGMKIDG